MRPTLILVGVITLMLPARLFAQARAPERPHSYVPAAGFVPDSLTAVRIAVAVWTPIYGHAVIDREQPYRAELHGGVWRVVGSLKRGPGGVALAEIAKRDGRILRVSHGK
jgi:hypothetical protein